MPTNHTDRNLLFGVLALQADLLDQGQFAEICVAWTARKDTPLADLLVERGWLTEEDRAHVEYLLRRKLSKHEGDAHAGLAAVAAATPGVQSLLESVADEDVRRSVAGLPGGPAGGHTSCSTTDYVPRGRRRYTQVRLHARGGIGQVWLARDEDLGREVALKELRPERAGSPAASSRFLEEAKVTGQLEHPGIVPVYELVREGDGQAFYAMRFVGGRTLADAIKSYHVRRKAGEAGPLDLRELLGHFVAVCNAAAYAHSRGVLHRDLKPQNVALGDFGEVLLLDWGLAKVLGRQEEGTSLPPVSVAKEGSREETLQGQVVGTPAYMAPEQARGRSDLVDQRSDVYGLGAILYEVLTGTPPFGGPDALGVLKQVVQEPPARPTGRVPATPRALEAVCLKALAKDREARYRTALELAAEVQHFLADEPVAAYPEPWPARAGRWARRHRTALVAAGVFLVSAVLTLAAGSGLILVEQRRTAEQKRRAEANYVAARTLTTELIGIAEERLPQVPRSERVRKDLLEAALPAYQEFLRQQPDDPELRVWTSKLHRYAANVRRLLNETRAAEEAYRESIRLGEALVRDSPADPWHRDRLSQTLRDYSHLQKRAGRLREASASLGRAVELAEGLLADHPDNTGFRRGLAIALSDRSELHYLLGHLDACEAAAGRASALLRGLLQVPEREAHPLDPVLLAGALNWLGVARRERGRADAALEAHAEAAEHLRAMLTRKDDNNARQYQARTLLEQGRAYLRTADGREQAGKAFDTAILLWEDLRERFPQIAVYRDWLARAYEARGRLRTARQDYQLAGEDLQRAREALEKLTREAPHLPGYRAMLGRTCEGLARLAEAEGDDARAATWYRQAAAHLRQALAQDPENVRDRTLLEQVENERKNGDSDRP